MMFFFTSPIGLGHASRDVAIVQSLKRNKDIRLNFITGSISYNFISSYGYKVFNKYNPPRFNVESGIMVHSFRWLIKYFFYYKKCKDIVRQLIDSDNDKRIIVSDEDFASIAVAEERKRKRILVTDITETRFTSGIISIFEKKMNQKLNQMIKKCDCVIIPDYGDDKENIRYVGPIAREIHEDKETLRKRFRFDKKTILVSVGGTDSGRYLIEKSIQAFKKIKTKLDIDLVIVPGPSIRLNSSSDFRILENIANLHEYIYAADLIISLAGRSTMDESLIYNTAGIFIPLKNHFEQEACAKRLGFEFNDIFRLDKLIEEKITSSRVKKNKINGAKTAAEIISKFL